MVKALLDSVILIDHLNGIRQATEWLASEEWSLLAISAITRAEVLNGASQEESLHIASLLDSFHCLPLDARTADRAAHYRREFRLRLPDAFQAAVAESNQLEFVTRNTRDFGSNMFDFVVVPYQL